MFGYLESLGNIHDSLTKDKQDLEGLHGKLSKEKVEREMMIKVRNLKMSARAQEALTDKFHKAHLRILSAQSVELNLKMNFAQGARMLALYHDLVGV